MENPADMEVAIFGGGGTIGATTAYTLAILNPELDLSLIDVEDGVARGHAIDMAHANAHVAHSVGRRSMRWDGDSPQATVRSVHPDEVEECDPDVVVMAASAPRPEDAAHRGGRVKFLERNRGVADDVAEVLSRFDPVPVIVVTNPADLITYRLWQQTGWPRHRFLGYSLSETARVADAIARLRDVSYADVYCPVMGEHGEGIVPIFSRARVQNDPAEFTAEERKEVSEYARSVPYEIMDLRGHAETSRWVTGHGVALLASTLLAGGIDDPVCLSLPLDGEYGFKDVCLGVPVTLSVDGAAEILEWDLSASERRQFDAAFESVRADL